MSRGDEAACAPDSARLFADLQAWHATMREMEANSRQLCTALRCGPDLPLLQSAWALAYGYIAQLAARHGIDAHWLTWWWEECRLGDTPADCALPGAPPNTISTVAELAAVILADRARPPQEEAA